MEWENLLEVMRTQGAEGTAQAVLALTDGQRRALAPPVGRFARSTDRWWDEDDEFFEVFRENRGRRALSRAAAVAAVGILPASKLPGVLRRLWLDLRHSRDQPALVNQLMVLLETRGLTENPRLAAELARRVRDGDASDEEWFFDLALELARRNPAEPPSHPAFTRLWLTHEQRVAADLRAHPGWSVLVLRALEMRGVGQMLEGRDLAEMLARLTAEGLVPRADLLDACIGALQTSDRKLDLRGLITLHERLDPSGEEVRGRIGQYVSVTAGAPQFVATLVQDRLRALDSAGLLAPAVLAQLTAAVLVRPDKALFRAQLTWLRVALKTATAERESLILATTAGFGHPDWALQKRVLDLLTPYASDLSAPARQELAAAAEALVPDLRPVAAGLFGGELFGGGPAGGNSAGGNSAGVGLGAEDLAGAGLGSGDSAAAGLGAGNVAAGGLAGVGLSAANAGAADLAAMNVGVAYLAAAGLALEPPIPSPLIPITAAEEVAEELSVFYEGWQYWQQVDAPGIERILAALVQFSWSDPERLREVLEPLMREMPWLPDLAPPSQYQPWPADARNHLEILGRCLQSARVCAERPAEERHRQLQPLKVLLATPTTAGSGVLNATLLRRLAEIASGIWWAPIPVLLATPTTTDGVLEGKELQRRLELLEAAGCRPWPHDLAQAWLRVAPAERGQLLPVVQRFAGPEAGARLSQLDAAGAQVGLESWTRQTHHAVHYYEKDEFQTTLVATLTPKPAAPGPWDLLWTLPRPEGRRRYRDTAWLSFGPMTLPFDRDAVAAHLVQDVPGLNRGGGEVIRAHGEVPGPIGPASQLLYCYGLGLPAAEDRAGATEALIAVISRGELDAAGFGRLLGEQIADRVLKPNRLVEALRGVGQAGAWPQLGQILGAALPRCLPRAGAEPAARLADLLALAVEAAQFTVAAGVTPDPAGALAEALDEVADRPGSSRLRSEARRLRQTLSGAQAPGRG